MTEQMRREEERAENLFYIDRRGNITARSALVPIGAIVTKKGVVEPLYPYFSVKRKVDERLTNYLAEKRLSGHLGLPGLVN